MNDHQIKAYDFAAETAKQIITLSTAIITVSVALAGSALEDGPSLPMVISWLFFLLAILFGILTLGNLTGNIAAGITDIYAKNVKTQATIQWVSFIIALASAGLVGYQLKNKPDKKDKTEKIIINSRVNGGKVSIDTIMYKHE